MNERIRELALQVDLMRYPSDGINIQIEKFAELVVQECAGLCSATAAGRDAEAIEEAILKHFGVDE